MINEVHEDTIESYYRADDVTDAQARTDALAEYIKTRTDWPRLQIAENEHGTWDIVVRMDGGYGRDDAESMLRWISVQVARIQRPEAFSDAA